MRIGTSHFVSVRAANLYYSHFGYNNSDVLRKIVDGEIHIGKPNLKPGERLEIIDSATGRRWDGRYAIVEEV